MADFNVQLADPQGRGTDPVAPVQQQAVNTSPMNVLNTVGSIFVKGLEQNTKDAALARKNAVIGEYINSQKVYDDALTTGQWNASQTATASRANYTKFMAAYPEYVDDLKSAREAFYGGSETGEAQKKIDAEKKQLEADIGAASGMGYTFYPGMSDEAKNKTLDAYRYARRLEIETTKQYQANAENRAQNAEGRADTTFKMSVDDYVGKEKAYQGARELAAANFDSIGTTATDLLSQMQKGTMPPEQALAIHTANIGRVKAGLLAIAGKNPEAAAPWVQLFNDLDATIQKQLDPTKKTADEAKILQDRFNSLITRAKIAAVESNPKLTKAVVASQLFPGEAFVTTMASSRPVKEWLMDTVNGDKPKQVVGTVDDKVLFQTAKDAITRLQTGNYTPEDKEKATKEAANMINNLLEQTTTAGGEMNPAALKQASTFFASPEFGRMALAGQVDKQTAANAQHVFQTQYEPAVKNAIVRKLEDNKIGNSVEAKIIGNNVTFQQKTKDVGAVEALSNFSIHGGMDGIAGIEGRKNLKDAEAGLNQLIRLHAHLEGTTDYAKYWEAHKHQLMPSVYPDPNKLKPGQVEGGYKYIGGNYRDRSNWIAEPVKPASK